MEKSTYEMIQRLSHQGISQGLAPIAPETYWMSLGPNEVILERLGANQIQESGV